MKKLHFNDDGVHFFVFGLLVISMILVFWGLFVYYQIQTVKETSSMNVGCTILGLLLACMFSLFFPTTWKWVKEDFPFYFE